MMTYNVFKKEVIQMLRQYIHDDDYINALSKDMKRHYQDTKEIEKIVGEPQLSVDGYVLSILFMYPELP